MTTNNSQLVIATRAPYTATASSTENFSETFNALLMEGAKRAFIIAISSKAFEAAYIMETPYTALIGSVLGFAILYSGKNRLQKARADFSSLSTIGKISSLTLPLLIGLIVPVTINSLTHSFGPAAHLNFLSLTLALNILCVPLIKKFQPNIEEYLFKTNEFRQLESEKIFWRKLALYTIFAYKDSSMKLYQLQKEVRKLREELDSLKRSNRQYTFTNIEEVE